MTYFFNSRHGKKLLASVVCIFSLLLNTEVIALDLEPRAYINTPTGLNFLLIGYQNAEGGLVQDPSLPVTDAQFNVDQGFIGYVHTLGISGKSAKVGMVLPYASMDASGFLDGDFRTREADGVADPAFYFTINLLGAPALTMKEFSSYSQDIIVGLSFKLTAPLGEYENDKLLNLGTNRWSFEPEIGISKRIGNLTLESAASVFLYTENDDFVDGMTRKQEPIYAVQVHAIYSFPKNIWASIGATYFTGGVTSVDGVQKTDELENWRTGFTVALPLTRHHSIKLFGHSGVSTRIGTDYDAIGVAWQYRWGRDF